LEVQLVAEYWEIHRKLLEHLTKVSRLELTEEETEKFTDQLKVILEAFKEIDKVDTDEVEPSFHPSELKNVLREDVVKPWDWNPLENAEHTEGKYFKGPKIT
jgi:aspartyl-tRNA(Asn)/glutamyl-tRNA(Gln) amidotransferase subunit C